jgi:hypothetical protein
MKGLKRQKTLMQGLLRRRFRMQTLPKEQEPERSEAPTVPIEPRGAKGMRQKGAEIYRRIESVFGTVPTFLDRLEDVRAILTYKPPDNFQSQYSLLPLHSHPSPTPDDN